MSPLGRSPVRVTLWGRTIGAAAAVPGEDYVAFQYDPAFVRSGIQVSPLMLPLSNRVHTFPNLPRPAFKGLPGLLADALPDRFGNALIDAWLARSGRSPSDFTPLERLCYLGERGMGALSFAPALGPSAREGERVEVAALVALASEVLQARESLQGRLEAEQATSSLAQILQVGTSAGGARAKAVIAWNPHTHEVRSGQLQLPPGFEPWLLKFDGVSANRDKELADPQGYGVVELAYAELAGRAGVRMMPCRLLEEGGRRHFMTRRFDRVDGGRLHMQSLAALAHLDFNAAGAHSYEQAFDVIRRLGLGIDAAEQQYRRMVFNLVARNQDDHVKNIAFLMDRSGKWALSPAFDVTWSFNPNGDWTRSHQMTVNGRQDGFSLEDLRAVARVAGLKRGRDEAILQEVLAAVRAWPEIAAPLGISGDWIRQIADTHRLRW